MTETICPTQPEILTKKCADPWGRGLEVLAFTLSKMGAISGFWAEEGHALVYLIQASHVLLC